MNTLEKEIINRVLVKYKDFGNIIANTKFIPHQLGDAPLCTDGKRIYYNPEFLYNLSEDKQTFYFAHEISHIALNHIKRSKGKDYELFNIAADAVINAQLKKDGLPLSPDDVDMPEASKFSAEEIYDKLVKEKQEEQKQQKSGNSSNSQNFKDKSSSQNSLQLQNLDNENENSQNLNNNLNDLKNNQSQNFTDESSGQSSSQLQNSDNENENSKKSDNNLNTQRNNQSQNSNDQSEKKKPENKFSNEHANNTHKIWKDELKQMENDDNEKDKKINEEIEKFGKMKEKDFFDKMRKERKERLKELKKTLREQFYKAGSTTNSDHFSINNINKSKSLVDWTRLLKDAVNIDIDWTFKNPTLEDGIISPYIEDVPEPETEILLDTSGSINDILLRNFLMECLNILKSSKVKVGCFDTKFYGFNDIRNKNDIEKMKFVGRGGTDFNVAINAFSNRVENKIIFTDGRADMPTKVINVIWIVFGNKKINPPGGKVIYINEEQLDKLFCITNEEKSKGMKR